MDILQASGLLSIKKAWAIVRHLDESCMRDIGLAGYGGIIRNDLGSTVFSFASSISNDSAIEMELFALWQGILELKELGVYWEYCRR